ncbi:hypothetical protein AB0B66_23750 [Catellatospora sp. NPDC049111]|uniref:hypothetical protein n=1 Tax=Catellatospora sp. NPDC049111 TaxID=3155271 RepID=UPI0033D05BE0
MNLRAIVGLGGAVVLAAVAYASDLVGALSYLRSDAFVRWNTTHATEMFWGSVAVVLSQIVWIVYLYRKLAAAEASSSGNRQELADLSLKLSTAEKALAALAAEPTEHDIELYGRFLAELPPTGVTIDYLAKWFTGSSWEWHKLRPLDEFRYHWSLNTYFDDQAVDDARKVLETTCNNFMSAIALRTFKKDPREEVSFLDEDRFPSYKDFHQERTGLVALADSLLQAHRALVDAGRSAKLYRAQNPL